MGFGGFIWGFADMDLLPVPWMVSFTGIVLACTSVLVPFMRFQYCDLLLLVAFLGTAIGLSLRKQYPLPYLILGIACLSALALASWVASVA